MISRLPLKLGLWIQVLALLYSNVNFTLFGIFPNTFFIWIIYSLEICAVLHAHILTKIFGPTVEPTHICVVSQFDTQ